MTESKPTFGIVIRAVLLSLAAVILGAALVVGLVKLGPHISPREPADTSETSMAQAPSAGEMPAAPSGAKLTSGETSATGTTLAPQTQEAQSSPFVGVAEAVLPAVVSIETERTLSRDMIRRPDLRRLFPDSEDDDIEVPSSGSGFITDAEGYVITNNHVVRNANNISVTLMDGSSHEAELVGSDPATDLALLKIQAGQKLPHVTLGDSDNLRIGEWVAAIGNPFGNLEGSLTVGVVSATGRNSLNIAGGSPTYQDFIQTDASINFGNSGGPLVNTRGEAIGINTAFNAPGRGIGFAIAMNMAQKVIEELKTRGRVVRGYLGIRLGTPDAQTGEELGIPAGEGILVTEVMDGTPADEAGLETGDVILEFDGFRATDTRSFMMHVARTPVGEEVEILFVRDGHEKTTAVRLMERPGEIDAPQQPRIITPQDQETDPDSGLVAPEDEGALEGPGENQEDDRPPEDDPE